MCTLKIPFDCRFTLIKNRNWMKIRLSVAKLHLARKKDSVLWTTESTWLIASIATKKRRATTSKVEYGSRPYCLRESSIFIHYFSFSCCTIFMSDFIFIINNNCMCAYIVITTRDVIFEDTPFNPPCTHSHMHWLTHDDGLCSPIASTVVDTA